MYTELGKYLRKLRIEKDILLKDMAEDLNITPAYLSSIEHGKREASIKLIDLVISKYELSMNEQKSIFEAFNKSKSQVKLNLKKTASNKHKDLGLAFARKFEGLSEEEIEEILSVLKGGK